jgi:hypothetical protein
VLVSLVFGVIGGALAWAVMEVLVRPYQRFMEIRSRAATALEVYERWNPWGEQGPPANWTEERARAYRDSGAEILAFAASEWFMPKILRRQRIDMPDSGFAFLEMSYLDHGAPERKRAREDALRGLRLRDYELHS